MRTFFLRFFRFFYGFLNYIKLIAEILLILFKIYCIIRLFCEFFANNLHILSYPQVSHYLYYFFLFFIKKEDIYTYI